jgi:hypothetical protein
MEEMHVGAESKNQKIEAIINWIKQLTNSTNVYRTHTNSICHNAIPEITSYTTSTLVFNKVFYLGVVHIRHLGGRMYYHLLRTWT